MNEEFYQEATEWMTSLNYSEHFRSGNKSSITFMNNNLDEYYPSITCFINEVGEKRCKLSDFINFKMLILISNEIDFKHLKILKYIETFKHYSELASQFPPF